MFTINVIMTVIDVFQQLNLFVFELFFYVIGDMSIKSIVKFVVSLTSFLKKSTNYLKNVIFFYKILGLLLREMGPFFSREIFICCGALGLGLSCQGLEPALGGIDWKTFSYPLRWKQYLTSLLVIIFLKTL